MDSTKILLIQLKFLCYWPTSWTTISEMLWASLQTTPWKFSIGVWEKCTYQSNTKIFSGIFIQCHTMTETWKYFFFFLVDYISYNNYWEKKNENKDLGYFLSLHKLLQFYWFVLLLPALFGGKKSHIFLVSLSILPFNLSFSRAVIIRCWVTFCLRQIHKFVQFCFRAEVECNHMCHQKKIK